jgi:hypothetical protein
MTVNFGICNVTICVCYLLSRTCKGGSCCFGIKKCEETRHDARTREVKNACVIFVATSRDRKPLGKIRRRWTNIKRCHSEIRWVWG